MRDRAVRVVGIVIITLILALICFVRLFNLQIIHGTEYRAQASQRLYRAYAIPAPRGEILDRNGVPLVKNRMGYTVRIEKTDLSDDEFNKILYNAAELVATYGSEIDSIFPIVMNDKGNLEYDFTIEKNGGTREVDGVTPKKITKVERKKDSDTDDDDVSESDDELSNEDKKEALKRHEEDKKKAEQEHLEDWKKTNKLTKLDSISDIFNYYKEKYSVPNDFDDKKALAVVAVRYAMEMDNFSEKNPYTMARDISELAVQKIKEQHLDFKGVDVVIEPVRIFAQNKMASHILGRTGKIYAEEYEKMKYDGYGMHDIIGKDGLEKALEKYLKGIDGYKSVEMKNVGGTTEILEGCDPTPGNYVKLTLDSRLQKATETALLEHIMTAVGPEGAGAAIVVNPQDGGVLSMASYPTYDLATFNDDYEKLLNSKSKPLINRALNGTYSPGSTFKPLTAIAGLEGGTITPDSYITDLGKYTFYDSYQPTCLVYSSSGATHGTINVSEAIGVSCNYFFYDIGRRMGIEKIDEYATAFGLGQHTGIELDESMGILASPQEREAAGGTWYPGDVLQTAIGQSDNLFTPVQLASYIATILNKGKRLKLHLVDEIAKYGTGEVVLKKEAEVMNEKPISDSTYDAVKKGMRQVVTSGTASASFATCKYAVAGKTGTAEVPDGADNVLFAGFAPYENPEIVVVVIIEHGASSSHPASCARDIIDSYMSIKNGNDKKAD